MDAQRFDALTKAFAVHGVSRRTVVAALVGAVAGGLRSAVRAAGATADDGASPGTPRSARDDDQLAQGNVPSPTCPACGTCRTCRVASATSAGDCGDPCVDPCLANALCEAVQGDDACRQLADVLAADGFAPAGEPEAVAIEKDGTLRSEQLVVRYVNSRDSARTATLEFLRTPGGTARAHAIVSEGQTPLYALVVAADGRVNRVPRDAAPAVARAGGVATDYCEPCDACDEVCRVNSPITPCLLLGTEECESSSDCLIAAKLACADLIPAPEAPDVLVCRPFCDMHHCGSCEQACETRSSDCRTCIDGCQQAHPDQRCVEGRCRCVEDDPQVGDTCGPVDDPICCDQLRCEVCDFSTRQCRSRCRGTEVCCEGLCRTDVVACGNACCPPIEEVFWLCCDNTCVDGQFDRENCGACGVQCAAEEICADGLCRTCDPALCESFADGRCVVGCREDEVCDPGRGCLPRSDEPVDASYCPTWLSEGDLLTLVAGGTSVTSLTSFDGPDDLGNPTVFCLWDVVGNPLPAEPWFDWVVSVQLALKMWGDVSPANWEAGLDAAEAEIGCEPATLPDNRTPVCLRDRPETVDVTVRLDAFRFLWLRLTSSTTGETPDYPKLREAAERIAAFLIARLNPSSPNS